MKPLFFFLLVLSTCNLAAQSLSSYKLDDMCGDSQALYLSDFNIFQTDDDTYEGVRTTESCIPIIKNSYRYYFDTNYIDTNKPIFMTFKEDTIYTEPNTLFEFGIGLFNDYRFGGCDSCTVASMHFNYPDFDNNILSEQTFINEIEDSYYNNCLGTNKIDGQFYSGFFIKLYPKEDCLYRVPSIFLSKFQDDYIVPDTLIYLPSYGQSTDTIETDAYEITDYYYTPFFQHVKEGFPSFDNKCYYNIYLEEDELNDTKKYIKLQSESALVFQNYTEIRGGLINESDSIRHEVELNIGENLCIAYIELIIDDGAIAFMPNSTVYFGSSGACIGLQESKMIFKSGTDFTYGDRGAGMLAMKNGSKIIIEKDASLTMDGIIVLPQDGHIYLEENSKLTFTKQNFIDRQYRDALLYIHVGKGSVDLSEYDDDLDKIRLIYDTDKNNEEISQLEVFPNPAYEKLFVKNIDYNAKVDIYDLMGNKVLSTQNNIRQGIDVSNLPISTYVIQTMDEGILKKSKFMKVN